MNKNEKERIVRGFLKFGFEKKMINDDIISNLSSNQIDSLIKLSDLEFSDLLFNNIGKVLDMFFDNQKHFIHDIVLINNLKTFGNAMLLFDYSKIASNSIYHEMDMKLIADASTAKKREYLYLCATNNNSLNSNYHEMDMKAISDAKNDYVSYWVYEYSINENSLDSKYHISDLTLIKNTSSPKISHYLYNCAINKNSLNSDNHINDMNLIKEAKDDYTAKYLSLCACNIDSLNSIYHEQDMKLINSASDHITAKCLYECAINKNSLDSYNHTEDMESITKIDKNISKYLKICISSVVLLSIINIHELINLFSNIKNEAEAKKMYEELFEKVSEKESVYVEDSSKISKIKILKK